MPNTPDSVIQILRWLCGARHKPTGRMPDHPFFECAGKRRVLVEHTLQFPNVSQPTMRKISHVGYIVTSRSSMDNSDGTIEWFLDWLRPYVLTGSGFRGLYALTIHEYQTVPTCYYVAEE